MMSRTICVKLKQILVAEGQYFGSYRTSQKLVKNLIKYLELGLTGTQYLICLLALSF
jgi:hypothetical protein